MAVIKSGASTDQWTIDATSKSGRVTLYDSSGRSLDLSNKATYSGASSAFTPPASAQDAFTVTGSSSKIIRVLRMWVSSVQTTAGLSTWFIKKRSSANSGGTSATVDAIAHDSANGAASATALQYTANPTAGTLVGSLWVGHVDSPAVATAGIGTTVMFVDFMALYGQPVVLRSAAEVVAWNFNGASPPAGFSMVAGATWTEEAS